MSQAKTVSLLGCGWLGIALAHSLLERGLHVRGSTTHSSRVALLSSLGVEPLLLRLEGTKDTASSSAASELVSDTSVSAFFSTDCVVISLPPEAALGADYHLQQVRTVLELISSLNSSVGRCKQIVYVSSTSVYGSSQGQVDETSVCAPDSESGSLLVEAERMLAAFSRASGVGVTIVRPGGLIGPGRHPGLFLAGRQGLANGGAPVNMVHQLDLVAWMTSLIVDHPTSPGSTEIFNIVSPDHPLRAEFYPRAARAIGVEPPTFQGWLSDGTASGPVNENVKVVSADKIVRVTGLMSRFASLYEAIGAV